MNLQLWTQHGVEATSIMAAAVDNDEAEDDVLLQLYELPSRSLSVLAA